MEWWGGGGIESHTEEGEREREGGEGGGKERGRERGRDERGREREGGGGGEEGREREERKGTRLSRIHPHTHPFNSQSNLPILTTKLN